MNDGHRRSPRVGFIGLGSQGGPMARRIVEDGYPTTLWARRPESLEPFAGTATAIAATPADLGAASEIACICVVADDDVDDVVSRDDGVLAGMAPGGVIVVHSTVHPATCRRLADRAAERRLLVMAGGTDEALERCRPVFETFADPIIHLGPVGSGAAAKAPNNLVFTAHLGIAIDAFTYAEDLGVDRAAAMAQVLDHGSGGSRAAGYVAMASFDTAVLQGFADLLRKDVDIALDLADTQPALLGNVANAALRTLADPSA